MIFYFSGTGNSKWVAQTLAQTFSEKLVAIGDYFQKSNDKQANFSLEKNEKIGFVCPIYSWGLPPIVNQFIQKIQFENYDNNLIYCIFTCGSECGSANKMFEKALKQKNLQSHHIYSIRMPNNYIVMQGFDIPSVKTQKTLITNAKKTINLLIEAISNDKPINHYSKGHFVWLKSGIIFHLFVRFSIDSRPYYTTDACNSCGLCENKCPTKNIIMENGKPVWSNNCTQCLACIHNCPTQAIQYGKTTLTKGRYTFSDKLLQ